MVQGKPQRGITRDPERTRGAILAAATQEFTANGLTGARVDAIAQRARVNKRMIYHYFGDKDGLYLAVLEATYGSIRAAELDLHLTDRDPVDGMRELVLFTWRYFLAHPEFLSLLGTENLHKAAYLKRSKRIRELHSRRPVCFAPASIRSSSTSPSRRSASSISPTATRSRPSSAAISRRRRASRRASSTSSMSSSTT